MTSYRRTTHSAWPWMLVAASCLELGCYTGYGNELDLGQGANASSTSDDDDAETETGSGEPAEEGCEPPAPGLRRLTPVQYDRTVATITAVDPEDPPSAGFIGSWVLPGGLESSAGHLSLATPHVAQLMQVAESLGERVALDPSFVAACMAAQAAEVGCADTFVDELLRRVFRREPDAEQRASYLAFFEGQYSQYDVETAIRMTTQRALMSPDFLFRTELGDGSDSTELDAYERASLVSYVLTDGPPDPQLYAAARDGHLLDKDVMATHVERLLSSRASARGVTHFMQEYLQSDAVESATKDTELFPNFDDELAADMARETEEFVAHVLWEGDGTLRTMLTADYTVANDRLGELYGLDEPLTDEFSLVDLPAERQAGVLGHASFLAARSSNTSSSIVLRGLYVTEALLCQHMPPPPPEVADATVDIDDSNPLTQRDRLEQHRNDPVCAACHNLFDPLGYPFESFDATGAFRQTEAGLPLDLSTNIPAYLDPDETAVKDVTELGQRLAQLDVTYDCLAQNLFTYTVGSTPEPLSCQIDDLREIARQTDGSIAEMIVSFITSDGFFWRIAPEGQA